MCVHAWFHFLKILRRGLQLLAPGGELLPSTCVAPGPESDSAQDADVELRTLVHEIDQVYERMAEYERQAERRRARRERSRSHRYFQTTLQTIVTPTQMRSRTLSRIDSQACSHVPRRANAGCTSHL